MSDSYTLKVDRAGHGEICCNGERLDNVVSFEIRGGVHRITTLTLLIDDIDVDASFEGLVSHSDDVPPEGKLN
jgi:hypothetical protein